MLMPIGQFASLTGLTVKALRHYDEIGLLRPERVDPETGYRLYAPSQLHSARLVRRLRALDVPLEEIRVVLEGGDLRAVLSAQLERIEARAERDALMADELRRLIGGEEDIVPKDVLYRIEVKEIPERDVMVIRERVRSAELPAWMSAAMAELFEYAGEQGIGPPFGASVAVDDDFVDAEAGLPVASPREPKGRIEARHEPAYRALVALQRGPYDAVHGVHRALWAAITDQGIEPAGEPRTVYLSDPADSLDPADNLVEVVWPVDVPAGWQPNLEIFTKPLPAP
jgi:DNA-binding transcriptional MerR regulator